MESDASPIRRTRQADMHTVSALSNRNEPHCHAVDRRYHCLASQLRIATYPNGPIPAIEVTDIGPVVRRAVDVLVTGSEPDHRPAA